MPGFLGTRTRARPFSTRGASQFAVLAANDQLASGNRRGELQVRDFAGLEGGGQGVFSAGSLQGEVKERNKALVNGPGRVLAVQAEGADEQFALRPGTLEEKPGAVLGKYQWGRFGAFEAGILVDLDFHEIAEIRREERVENGMVGGDELELLGSSLRADGSLGFEPELAQAAIDSRGGTIDDAADAAAIS